LPKIEALNLRVNDTPYDKITLRFGMEDGYPGGRPELVVLDPQLGEIILSDICKIELQENDGEFKPITTHALMTRLRTVTEGW
jgi:hypothetical protein